MSTKGSGCKIDAVQVAELSVSPIKSQIQVQGLSLVSKYVLLNSETMERYGSGTFDTWSDATIQALRALMALMEKDICSQVFTSPTTTGGSETKPELPEDEVPSL